MDRFWAETGRFPQWYGHVPQICPAKQGSLFNQVEQLLYGAHFGKCLMTIIPYGTERLSRLDTDVSFGSAAIIQHGKHAASVTQKRRNKQEIKVSLAGRVIPRLEQSRGYNRPGRGQ